MLIPTSIIMFKHNSCEYEVVTVAWKRGSKEALSRPEYTIVYKKIFKQATWEKENYIYKKIYIRILFNTILTISLYQT